MPVEPRMVRETTRALLAMLAMPMAGRFERGGAGRRWCEYELAVLPGALHVHRKRWSRSTTKLPVGCSGTRHSRPLLAARRVRRTNYNSERPLQLELA